MLTPKQEKFISTYLIIGNAAEAYRRCYNCSQMKPASIHTCVKELLANPQITSRLKEYQGKIEALTIESKEKHLDRLEDFRDLATKSKKWGIALRAEVMRGMALGFYMYKGQRNRRR